MPPLPSQPEVMYSAPGLPDFYQQMGRFTREEVVVIVDLISPSWNETVHLFVPYDLDGERVVATAKADKVLPMHALMSFYIDSIHYSRDWGRKDGLPDVVDGTVLP